MEEPKSSDAALGEVGFADRLRRKQGLDTQRSKSGVDGLIRCTPSQRRQTYLRQEIAHERCKLECVHEENVSESQANALAEAPLKQVGAVVSNGVEAQVQEAEPVGKG